MPVEKRRYQNIAMHLVYNAEEEDGLILIHAGLKFGLLTRAWRPWEKKIITWHFCRKWYFEE
jgi:hypothetical protein